MVSTLQIIVWVLFFIGLYILVFWLITFIENFNRRDTERPLKRYPKVTVAIPAYNEQESIRDTLLSVISLDYPKDKLEIIVVNDGSVDKTKEIVETFIEEKKEFDIKLITQKNSGKGAALNQALYSCDGEFFTCLDADSFIASDALQKMLIRFDEKDVAVVLPLMKIKDPKTFIEKLQWSEYLINFFYKSLMSFLNCVHVAPGPFSVYRKKALIKIGGFAKNNLTEDLEVSLRVQKAHYRIVQVLNTEVYTNAPKSLSSFYKQRNRWYKGTMINMFNYKWMLFNREYGDFGMLQMPRVFISGFLAVFIICLALYRFVFKSLLVRISNLASVNFDILEVLSQFHININWIGINFTNIFFAVISIVLGGFIIWYAHKNTKERILRYGIFSLPAYLLLYSMLVSGVWVGVFIEMLFGRKQRW